MKETGKKSRVLEVYGLTFIDLLCTMISFGAAAILRHIYDANGPLDKNSAITACLLLLLCTTVYNVLMEGNRDFFKRDQFVEFMSVAKCTFVVLIITLVLMFFMQSTYGLSRILLAVFALINVVLTFIVHCTYKKAVIKHYKTNGAENKVLVVTTMDRGITLMEQLRLNLPWDAELVAVCVMDSKEIEYDMNGITVIANADNLYDAAGKMALDEVLIDLPEYSNSERKKLVTDLQQMGVTCHCIIHTFQIDGSTRIIDTFGNKPVVSYHKTVVDFRSHLVKRAMDICGALVGLLITAVVTPFVALAIKIEAPGPVFFSQERVGRNGRRFKIYKFRSMYMDAEERKKELMEKNQMSGLMFKMDDDPRITKVGKFIRKTSIDELPQFYNILVGQMSLVGTRPPTVDEFNQYSLYYKRRLSMTPGLTGMWQATGRSNITDFDEVVKLDLEYIDNWSIGLDIKILFMTVYSVLFSRGAV